MSDDEEYEYENAEDDEEYNYEDGDEEEEEVHSPVASAPPSATKTPASISKTSNPPSGTKEKNSLIRENSTSYELVVPLDSYVIRPLSDVKPLLEAIVSEVSVLLDISEDEAQTLLQQFKWDKEKLMDKYFNKYEQVRKDSGLDFFNPEIIDKLSTGQLFGQAGSKFKCRICHDEEADLSDSFTLGCNHHFCKDCYGNYLRAAVSDGPTCVSTHCPEHKCKQTVTKSVFHSFLTDPDERDKYDGYFLRNFIEKSKNMKYCPAPRCERVAIGSGITTVKCSCSFTFCFKCGEEAHDPCSCAQLTEWTDKCMNESETANWILANTRKCPSCTTRIEKNQGCNHMTCKVCKHEFCWICMGKLLTSLVFARRITFFHSLHRILGRAWSKYWWILQVQPL
jgi:ariadne-1